jgi:hypothetical protein
MPGMAGLEAAFAEGSQPARNSCPATLLVKMLIYFSAVRRAISRSSMNQFSFQVTGVWPVFLFSQ